TCGYRYAPGDIVDLYPERDARVACRALLCGPSKQCRFRHRAWLGGDGARSRGARRRQLGGRPGVGGPGADGIGDPVLADERVVADEHAWGRLFSTDRLHAPGGGGRSYSVVEVARQ